MSEICVKYFSSQLGCLLFNDHCGRRCGFWGT